MKRILIISTAVLGAIFLSGCGKDRAGGTGLELSRTEFLEIDPAGAEESIQITTGSTWSVTDIPDWIGVDPASGTGGATVTISISANGSPGARSAVMTVGTEGASRRILVTQLGTAVRRPIVPDSGFCTWLQSQGYVEIIDADSGEVAITDKGLRAQSMAPSHPSASNMIRSLKGLEFFPDIVQLDARLGTITEIDLSGNAKLKAVYLTSNPGLTALDISMLPDLELLQMAECGVMELDVTNNPELRYLSTTYNPIIELDVTKNTKLQQLYCTTNRRYAVPGDISTPVVSSLSHLDVSNCPELTDLHCGGNPFLTKVDVTANRKLKVLHTFGCGITELDTGNNPELETLQAFFSPTLAKVDVTNNPKLVWFYIDETAITEIDLSGNPLLAEFRCCDMNISELDLSHNPKLITLNAYGSNISEIDLSHNPLLVQLHLSRTLLTHLDVSMLSDLVELALFESRITSLDLTDNPKITGLGWTMAEGMVAESLDISGCRNLKLLQILSGGHNAIPGDDTLYLGEMPGMSTSANIRNIILDDTVLATRLNVTNNPTIETLSIQNCELVTATLKDNPNLRSLYFNGTDAGSLPTTVVQSGNAAGFSVITTPRP